MSGVAAAMVNARTVPIYHLVALPAPCALNLRQPTEERHAGSHCDPGRLHDIRAKVGEFISSTKGSAEAFAGLRMIRSLLRRWRSLIYSAFPFSPCLEAHCQEPAWESPLILPTDREQCPRELSDRIGTALSPAIPPTSGR